MQAFIQQPDSLQAPAPQTPAHEHGHRRAVYIVVILLGLVILGGVAYQAYQSGLLPWGNKKLMQEYNRQSFDQAAQFFKEVKPAPLTDADIKATAQFFKEHPAAPMTNDEYQTQAQAVDAAYQAGFKEWKANR